MRLALVSTIAFAALASAAFAQPTDQTTASPPPPPPPPPAAAPATTDPSAPAAAPAASPPATAPAAAAPASPPPPPPPPAPAGETPATATPAPPAPPAAAPPPATAPAAAPDIADVNAPPPPPPPPPPPTDPTAIAALNVLEHVCIPAANGGDWNALTKAAGMRKSRDNWVLKTTTYQFTVNAPGSNPHACIVDIVHPVDPEAPAKPIVIALHNWAAVARGWSLYRNDKSVSGATEYTTRSWEHTADGKAEALVIATMRKADGTPALKGADTSQMIYRVGPAQ